MKIRKDGSRNSKKVLLLDKQKAINKRYKRNKEAEDLKYRSSDFKMVSLSGQSFSEVVKMEKEKIRKEKKNNIKRIFLGFFVSLLIIFFILYILIRFRYIKVDLSIFENNINTSYLYNNTDEDILNLLFEYINESNTEYTENNYAFELIEDTKKEEKTNDDLEKKQDEKIKEEKNTNYDFFNLLKKYKEIIENTKIEYKRKEEDNLKYKEEINVWAYNQPVYTNKFLVDKNQVIYDSLALKEKVNTTVDALRSYFKKYYIYDYVIDKIKILDKDLNIENLEIVKKYVNEDEKDNFKNNVDYSNLNKERELNALKKILIFPKIKNEIFPYINFERKDEYIKININLEKKDKILKTLKNIVESIKEDENFKKDIAEYIYIYLNRKPKYLIKEYSKNEILNNINKFVENFEENEEEIKNKYLNILENIKSIELIYYTTSYNSMNKSKNKISKIENIIEFNNFKNINLDKLKITKTYSYQEGKDIKASSKKSNILKDDEEIRKEEKKIIDEAQIEANKDLKIHQRIKEIKENYTNEDTKAVKDAKNRRNQNIVRPVLEEINKVLIENVKQDGDMSKINNQQEVKALLDEKINGKSKNKNEEKYNKKLQSINFKSDIGENLENIIYTRIILNLEGKTFLIKTTLTKENTLNLSEYEIE